MATWEFIKMHGLGNDFVVIDARQQPFSVTAAEACALADRHTGVGFDQLIIVEPSSDPKANAFMRIRNADGGEVSACGNATRCVARLLFEEGTEGDAIIETGAGLLTAQPADGTRHHYTVDMGPARDGWQDIPLAQDCDTDHLPLALGPLSDPVAVNVGNPHAVFFTTDAEAVPLAQLGPELEHNSLFPERANIGVAQIIDDASLRLRVWERGVGLTQACGTGACAAAVAAHRRGLTGRKVQVRLDGGALDIEWRANGHVAMTGPASVSFTGVFDDALIADAQQSAA
ncbi:MAG: diaminopimelate epimerase [Alphaproteobacteria bacterium]|nr:diaminopimelate epimerase [Alphaproteobacteria bacterium]